MKKSSMKELLGKKIVWLNEDNEDCVVFQTDDNNYYLLEAGRSKALMYAPLLLSVSEKEADEIVNDEANQIFGDDAY